MATKHKKIKPRVGFIWLILTAYLVFTLIQVPDISAENNLPLILGAHRGNSLDFLENTVPAIKNALEDPNYSFIEFDIYLFYIDRTAHAEKTTYEMFFRNIFKFIRNDFDMNNHGSYYANKGVDSYLKYIFLYRMLVLSLQHKHFKNSEQQSIGLLNYIISELKKEL